MEQLGLVSPIENKELASMGLAEILGENAHHWWHALLPLSPLLSVDTK